MSCVETDTQCSIALRLFGYPKLYQKGTPLHTTLPKKAMALLAYVAVTDEPIGRETAETLLWPDAPAKTAKSSLRNLLSKLRKEHPDLLTITTRTIALQPAFMHQIDVVAFQHGIAAIQRAAHHPEPLDLRQWQSALDCYQGDFLAGFHIQQSASFDEWSVLQREYLREQAITNLFSLSEAYAATAESDLALAALSRLLAIEPWHEAAYLHQLQLLQASGRRTEALQLYERYQALLAEEFALGPSTELTALYQQIKTSTITTTPFGTHLGPKPSSVLTKIESTTANKPADKSIPHNLPHPLRLFLGRAKELALIQQLITAPTCRLLTIIGLGGMGKTSLALAVAHHLLQHHGADFPDGIFFVPLLGINEPDTANFAESMSGRADDEHLPRARSAESAQIGSAIVTAIANHIGCTLREDLPSHLQLSNHLQTRRLLLVLDNFEHLLAYAGTVLMLLTATPNLKLLITSRARLNIRGETILPLEKLSLPSPSTSRARASADLSVALSTKADTYAQLADAAWQESEALTMFVQRARCIDPNFVINTDNINAIVRICQHVDGLPLGIELATSMLPLLSCHELAVELNESLDMLQADLQDLPADHHTLYAVCERSWRLLAPPEQLLFATLSIFPGTFERTAAKVIAGATTALLMRLLNQSLLTREGDARYVIHRTVHQYVQGKLRQWPHKFDEAQIAYARYYLELLVNNESVLVGKESALAIAQITKEIDNVFAAWRRAVAYAMVTELSQSMHVLFVFCMQQGLFADALELFDYALRHFAPHQEVQKSPANDQIMILIGRLQSYLGIFSGYLGRQSQAEAALRAGLSMLRQTDELNPKILCLGALGAAIRMNDLHEGRALLGESMGLANAADNLTKGMLQFILAEIECFCGQYEDARRLATDSHALLMPVDWKWGLMESLRVLGLTQLRLGNYVAAQKIFEIRIENARQQGFTAVWIDAMISRGDALRLQGQPSAAHQDYAKALHLAQKFQLPLLVAQAHWAQGCLAEQLGEYPKAKALLTENVNVRHPIQFMAALPTLGWALLGLGELDEAQAYFQRVFNEAETKHAVPICLEAQAGLAYIALLQTEAAHVSTGQHRAIRTQTISTFCTIGQHPASAKETRSRLTQLRALLDIEVDHFFASANM
ncbi:MAG: AAA family ATPase [Caldilineaceae bacterium]|nr:AAA family ATPase [Caldilineaceae bacterium]